MHARNDYGSGMEWAGRLCGRPRSGPGARQALYRAWCNIRTVVISCARFYLQTYRSTIEYASIEFGNLENISVLFYANIYNNDEIIETCVQNKTRCSYIELFLQFSFKMSNITNATCAMKLSRAELAEILDNFWQFGGKEFSLLLQPGISEHFGRFFCTKICILRHDYGETAS